MANGKFDIDVTSITQASVALQQLNSQQEGSVERTKEMQDALTKYGQAVAKLPEFSVLQPDQAKRIKQDLEDMKEIMIAAGASIEDIIRIRKEEKKLIGAEIVEYKKLTKEAKKRVKAEYKSVDNQKRIVYYKDKAYDISKGEVKEIKSSTAAFGKKVKGMAQYAASMVNVQLTLAGIIAKLIEARDISAKFGAMAKQVEAQWGKSNIQLNVASQTVESMYNEFLMSEQAAMDYTRGLARAGLEKEHMLKLGRELKAVEMVYGQSVQDQVKYISGLATNFGIASDEASVYLTTLKEASKEIPFLSMDEATQDWAELIDKTKAYNTDLLGTLALYNTLLRKEPAKALGLGEAPRAIKKEIVSTVAGYNRELSLGVKAALMEGMEGSIAEKALAFEKLAEEQGLGAQLVKAIEFAKKKTGGFIGAEQEIRLREILSQLNLLKDKDATIELSRQIAGGKIDTAGIKEFGDNVEKERKKLEEEMEKQRKNREDLISEGANLARNLTGILQQWMRKITDLFRRLYSAIEDLVDAIRNFRLFGPAYKDPEWIKDPKRGAKDFIQSGGGGAAYGKRESPISRSELKELLIQRHRFTKKLEEKLPGPYESLAEKAEGDRILPRHKQIVTRNILEKARKRAGISKKEFNRTIDAAVLQGKEEALDQIVSWFKEGNKVKRNKQASAPGLVTAPSR